MGLFKSSARETHQIKSDWEKIDNFLKSSQENAQRFAGAANAIVAGPDVGANGRSAPPGVASDGRLGQAPYVASGPAAAATGVPVGGIRKDYGTPAPYNPPGGSTPFSPSGGGGGSDGFSNPGDITAGSRPLFTPNPLIISHSSGGGTNTTLTLANAAGTVILDKIKSVLTSWGFGTDDTWIYSYGHQYQIQGFPLPMSVFSPLPDQGGVFNIHEAIVAGTWSGVDLNTGLVNIRGIGGYGSGSGGGGGGGGYSSGGSGGSFGTQTTPGGFNYLPTAPYSPTIPNQPPVTPPSSSYGSNKSLQQVGTAVVAGTNNIVRAIQNLHRDLVDRNGSNFRRNGL